MSHLVLIDASGFAYRAYHAMPVTRRADGTETHAVLGYMSMVWRLLSRAEADPYDYVAAVFDAGGRTFRHRAFADYKANRVRPPGLLPQLGMMRVASDTMGITSVELKGYEADDVIATLATRAKAQGCRTTIVTVDKDFSQLVEDNVIEIADPVQRARVLAADVKAKFGVAPQLVTDVQALCGDAVDGIPGVPGLGIKRAAGLIRRFGSLSALLKAIDREEFHGAPAVQSALRRSRKQIPLYLKLATLRRDAPVEIEFDALKPRAVSPEHLSEMLRALGAESRLANLFGSGERHVTRVEDRIMDPLAWWSAELKRPSRRMPEIPQCGFYRRRLVKGGPFVPARIWREPELDFVSNAPTGRDVLLCEVDGRPKDPYDQWGYFHPIPEKEYSFLVKQSSWARQHAPNDPHAKPEIPIDWNTVPI